MEEDGATFEDKTVHVRILRKKEGGILWGIGLWAAHNSHGRIQGGRGSHRTHPTPQHSYIQMEIYSDFIQAWRIEKHENGNSFLGGGGGRKGVSEEVETLGEVPPLLNYLWPRTNDIQ